MPARKLEEVAARLLANPEVRAAYDGMVDEYAWAVAEIERLREATPGTEEHRRLQDLGAAVDAYEAKKYPMGE